MAFCIVAEVAEFIILDGELWQARSKEILPAGTLVRVIRQDGVTLTVKKIENIKSSIEK